MGTRLLSGAEQRLAETSCQTVRLETAVDNASAIAFYKRHNYNITSTIPRYYPGGVNAFVFQKDLDPVSERQAGWMRVAIQGELGAFSHEAAKRMLPGWDSYSLRAFGGGF